MTRVVRYAALVAAAIAGATTIMLILVAVTGGSR